MNNLDKTIQPSDCKSKEEIRNRIDEIDREILNLFAYRFQFVKEIVHYKEKNSTAIIDQARKDLVIKERAEWANKLGLDAETFAQIYEILIDSNISKELEIAKSK